MLGHARTRARSSSGKQQRRSTFRRRRTVRSGLLRKDSRISRSRNPDGWLAPRRNAAFARAGAGPAARSAARL